MWAPTDTQTINLLDPNPAHWLWDSKRGLWRNAYVGVEFRYAAGGMPVMRPICSKPYAKKRVHHAHECDSRD